MARSANVRCAQLAEGLVQHNGARILYPSEANIIFFEMPRAVHKRMLDGGAVYYTMNGDAAEGDPDEPLIGRLVTDWSASEEAINQFLSLLRG